MNRGPGAGRRAGFKIPLSFALAFWVAGLSGTGVAQDPPPASEPPPRTIHGDAASGDARGQEPPPTPIEVRHRPRHGVVGTLSRSYLPAVHPGSPGYAPERPMFLGWKSMGRPAQGRLPRPAGHPFQRDVRRVPPGALRGTASGPRPWHSPDARFFRPGSGLFRTPVRAPWGLPTLSPARERLKPFRSAINGTAFRPVTSSVNGTGVTQGRVKTGAATINGSEIRIRR